MTEGAKVVVMWGAGLCGLLIILGLLIWLVLGRLGEILWELRALRSELSSRSTSQDLPADSFER